MQTNHAYNQPLPILSYPIHYMKSKSVLIYSHSNSVYDTTHDQSLLMTFVSVSIMFRELCADISHGCRSGKRLQGTEGTFPVHLRLATYYRVSRLCAPQPPVANLDLLTQGGQRTFPSPLNPLQKCPRQRQHDVLGRYQPSPFSLRSTDSNAHLITLMRVWNGENNDVWPQSFNCNSDAYEMPSLLFRVSVISFGICFTAFSRHIQKPLNTLASLAPWRLCFIIHDSAARWMSH